MSIPLTIVTYHYVRNTLDTPYPRINAINVGAFKGQISYLKKHYSIVSAHDVIATAIDSLKPLPRRPALLTFDDGYRDHFEFVLPTLREFGVSGAFFPPACTVMEKRLLDVNKIHFILAATDNIKALIEMLMGLIEDAHAEYNLHSAKTYWARWAKPGRWDSAEIMFIKRMLQKGLPPSIRSQITDLLFRKFVTNDEADFAGHLYMSSDQLSKLLDAGMYIGNHGYAHSWLNTLSPQDQEYDIDQALDFLNALGVDTNNWMMCYPYGGYNATLLEILRKKKCAVGLSVESGIANLHTPSPLTLPRIDTNDFPQSADAPIDRWTSKTLLQTERPET